jgi:hypothetical protein
VRAAFSAFAQLSAFAVGVVFDSQTAPQMGISDEQEQALEKSLWE